jgi:succinoglycan biosynthesis transport protein ExoP
MQPTETYSVSRRALDVEDYIDILRRHKGWIFGPFLLTMVVSVVGVYLWPDIYISKGVIKVEPQQVPESLVPSTMTHDMMDRINSMLQSIESRSSLTQIITTYNLYPKERSREPLEDVIDDMIKQIHIEPMGSQSGNRQVPAFGVTFSYTDRHLAQKVVQDLISKFIDESLRNQSNQTYQTTEFMKDEAESAQKELDAVESRLAAYKIQNNGRLPEQVNTNYQKLQALEASATNLSGQVSRYDGDRMMLESRLSLYTEQANKIDKYKSDPVTVSQQPKSQQLLKAEQEVDLWTNNLQVLQQKYQDGYPDVRSAKEYLKLAEAKRDRIIAEEAEAANNKEAAPGKPSQTPANFKESLERENAEKQLQMQIAADQNEVDQYSAQLKTVNQQIKTLQGRLDAVPESEKEYDDLLRERDIKKAQYEEMTKHLATAQVQQNLENKKYGESLEILDPASLPDSASDPKRPLVIAVGAGIGLLLGIVIAGAREMKDTSLKNLKDVRAYTQMAILGSIPLLENDFVVRRRRRLAWLGWTTACLTAVVLMSGSVVYYFSTKQ